MAFNRLTVKQIYDRVIADIESRLTSDTKVPSTSLLSVFAFGIAGGSYLVQGFLQWVYEQTLPDLADETGVGRWATILGLPKKAGEYASGEVAFTGTAATVVPSGTQIQNEDGLAYVTDEAFTIGTTTSVTAEAIEAGDSWNVTSGLTMVTPLSGVNDDVTLVSGFQNGVDEETFDNWVVRILQRLQNPPSSGTADDYERWALEVDGVEHAWCFEAEDWRGAGTIGLAVSGEDFAQIADTTSVETYVDSVKPIPAQVDYYSPAQQTITYEISITPNTTDVQEAIAANLDAMFENDAAPGGTIYLSRTGSAIATGGVSDYEITEVAVNTVPQTIGNLTADLNAVYIRGSITFSELT